MLANRKKLILPREKYFKTLNDMITGTAGTKLLESFTIFKESEIMVSKCGYLMVPGALPDIESYP